MVKRKKIKLRKQRSSQFINTKKKLKTETRNRNWHEHTFAVVKYITCSNMIEVWAAKLENL